MLLVTVEPIIFLFVLSFGAQMFVTQDLLFQRLCVKEFKDIDVCMNSTGDSSENSNSVNPNNVMKLAEIERHVVLLWMVWNVTYTAISVVSGQIFGHWMDRYSKKTLLLVPLIGQVLVSLGFVLISGIEAVPTWTAYILAVIGGTSGGFVVIKAACMSYVVERLGSKTGRTTRFSVLEGAFFVGGSCGLFAVRILLTYVHNRYDIIYLANMGVCVAAVFYTICILPEIDVIIEPENNVKGISRMPDNPEDTISDESPGDWSDSQQTIYPALRGIDQPDGAIRNATSKRSYGAAPNTLAIMANSSTTSSNEDMTTENNKVVRENENVSCFSAMTNAIKTTFKKRDDVGLRAMIIANIIANSLSALLFSAELDISYIYLKGKFNWTFGHFLEYFGIKTSCDGASLLLILPFFRWIKISDAGLGIMGGFSRTAFFIFLGAVFHSKLVYWAILANIFGFYTTVVSKSIMSKFVPNDEQGRVMTVLSSWEQIGSVLGSLSFDSLYSELLKKQMPGVTMFAASAVAGVITVIYCSLYFALLVRGSVNAGDDERRSILPNIQINEDTCPSPIIRSVGTRAQSMPSISAHSMD